MDDDQYTSAYQVFNDSIHGHIQFHPLLVKIIDTPQFQRLRYIKQLGGCYFVYPGATHTRFEHSLGVCHLAGELVETLQRNQSQLNITHEDVLCVKMAGLCHDLGHGPFSHMFDGPFLSKARPGCKWKHEQGSVDMFDYLIESNPEVKRFLEKCGIKEHDLKFVKEMIKGVKDDDDDPSKSKWICEGRDEDKAFLYDIVANKRNGVDVDKWDYFVRDSRHLGITISFDYSRLMKSARVLEVNGRREIAFRDKEVYNLYDMFYTRTVLHRRAYQHKTRTMVEKIICKAFLQADEHLKILGKNGKEIKMSECVDKDNMDAYTNLTDHVFHQILLSTDDHLEKARELLERLSTRRLYIFLGSVEHKDKDNGKKEEDIAKDIAEMSGTNGLTAENFICDMVKFDYGKRESNPMDKVNLYRKRDPNQPIKKWSQIPEMFPKEFLLKEIRVYCDGCTMKDGEKCFNAWLKKDEREIYLTPSKPDSTEDYKAAADNSTVIKQLFPKKSDTPGGSGSDQTQVQTSQSNAQGSKRQSSSLQQQDMTDDSSSDPSPEKKLKKDV